MQRLWQWKAPWTGIVEGHDRARAESLQIRRRKSRIVHDIQVQSRQNPREPELFAEQLIARRADHGFEMTVETAKNRDALLARRTIRSVEQFWFLAT